MLIATAWDVCKKIMENLVLQWIGFTLLWVTISLTPLLDGLYRIWDYFPLVNKENIAAVALLHAVSATGVFVYLALKQDLRRDHPGLTVTKIQQCTILFACLFIPTTGASMFLHQAPTIPFNMPWANDALWLSLSIFGVILLFPLYGDVRALRLQWMIVKHRNHPTLQDILKTYEPSSACVTIHKHQIDPAVSALIQLGIFQELKYPKGFSKSDYLNFALSKQHHALFQQQTATADPKAQT